MPHEPQAYPYGSASKSTRKLTPTCPRSQPRAYFAIAALALAASVPPAITEAQTVDTDFYVTDAGVFSSALSGNTLIIGGKFSRVGPPTGFGVPLDPSTAVPKAGFPRVNGSVSTAVSDGAGGWYIGGTFTQVGGIARNRAAHVLADNSVTAWNPDANSRVASLVFHGGVVYAGGQFTNIGGQARNFIAALDATTGSATAWNPNANSQVTLLAANGSNIYATGFFNNIGGQPRNNSAALDVGTGLATPWNPNARYDAIAIRGSSVYVGGQFFNIGGQPRNRIAELDLVNGLATAWNPNADSDVDALAVVGATVYVGGRFSNIGGAARNRIAALDAATGNATPWNPNADDAVTALDTDGTNVYVAGAFANVAGQPRSFMAALDRVTGLPTAWDPRPIDVPSLVRVDATHVFASGDVPSFGVVVRNRLAAIDITTGEVTPWNPGADGDVLALETDGTTVYAAGAFTQVGGFARNRIAAIDVATAIVNAWNPNADATVHTLRLSGSTVYAGGSFTNIGGQPRNRLAAIDVATAVANVWNPDANSTVYALAVDGSMIYAGGIFTTVGGQPRNRVVQIDAVSGLPTAWNPGVNDRVIALDVLGTRVYIGGWFTDVGGQFRNRIASVDAGTGIVTGWDPNADNRLETLTVGPATIYVGGRFFNIGGLARSQVAALDPVSGAATAWNPSANATVRTLATNSVNVFVGGDFRTVSLLPQSRIVKLSGSPEISIGDVSISEGNFGATNFNFTVSLSDPVDQDITVNYITSDGSATTADGDYAPTSGTLTILANTLSNQFTVNVAGDTKNESDETFTVTLSSPFRASILDGTALVTILNDDPVPTLTIADDTQNEGDVGTTNFNFAVSLSNPIDQDVTVNFLTTDGTATVAGGDFNAASGTLTISAGSTADQFTVEVNGDTKNEIDETFTVSLSGVIPGTIPIPDPTATGTITDDDPVSISIDDVTVTEGHSGSTVGATFTVSLSTVSEQTITVDFTTSDGSATTADNDYVAVSGTVTFSPDSVAVTIPVTVNGDDKHESDETFAVTLSNPSFGSFDDATGGGLIQNDEELVFTIDDQSVSESNFGTALDFIVIMNTTSEQTITVDFTTTDGTATTADSDYVGTSGTLTIPPDSTTSTISVPVNGDTKHESDEIFMIFLSNPNAGTFLDSVGTGTIENDDPVPFIEVDDVTELEGNDGTTGFQFDFVLTNATDVDVSFHVLTLDGTATVAGNDYTPLNGAVLMIPANGTSTSVTVQVHGDSIFELDEDFTISISNVVNATILDSEATGTIQNDDAFPVVKTRHMSVAFFEGDDDAPPVHLFYLDMFLASHVDASVRVRTFDGTALVSDNDYVPFDQWVTIPAGSLSVAVPITINGDETLEPDESFFVEIIEATEATVGPDSIGEIVILNDDAFGNITIKDEGLFQMETDATFAFTATVEVTGLPAAIPITADFSTSDGTATVIDNDYSPLSTTVTIPPGSLSVAVSLTIHGDMMPEADETFFMHIANPTNASLGADSVQTVTIENDDGPTAVGAGPVTSFALSTIAPNPARRSARIEYAVPLEGLVELRVLDIQGRVVVTLVDGVRTAGRHQATWHAADHHIAAGIYFVRFKGGGKTFVKRVMLLR